MNRHCIRESKNQPAYSQGGNSTSDSDTELLLTCNTYTNCNMQSDKNKTETVLTFINDFRIYNFYYHRR